jgi:lon-related putative ATP-dependent protease
VANRHKPKPSGIAALEPRQLRVTTDAKALGFKTTPELEPLSALIGQERALGAIKFGAEMPQRGYNMFVLGPSGFGRHTAIKTLLGERADELPAPDDWVYVNNFTIAHKPKALRLPAGKAIRFRDAMNELVNDLRVAVPAAFQADEYRERRRSLEAEFEEQHEQAFETLREKADAENVAILRTPMGFALAPMSDGKVIKPEVFNALPEATRTEMEEKINRLQEDLRDVLERMPAIEKEHRDQLRKLNADTAGTVVDASIGSIAGRFAEIAPITEHLKEVRDDLVARAELFLERTQAELESPFPEATGPGVRDARFSRYLVNVMVANDQDGDTTGAPLIIEDHPTLANVVGRIEHQSQQGALVTNFTMIRPGALHRANGGYLVLDARKVLSEMFTWEALKRALRNECITIVSPAEQLSLVSTVSLEPEPIPLKLKVVLIGERLIYYLLAELDPEFAELFKVQVDFNEELRRTPDNVALYARLIASICAREKLLPFNAAAVAAVIDEAVRMAEDAERISLEVGRLGDLLREADHWARQANRKAVTDAHVLEAVANQIHRADRLRELSHDHITRGTLLVDTEGEAVGQVNGLSVIGLGNFSFGRPTRITARTRVGSGKVVDIERETKLGGPLHSKGVLILTGFLAANFSLDAPMSLWASLVFEQSYGGVEGDSASSAELYALLSSLSGLPIRQSLAVTGSVNQHGEVQAIGGVNEKIEGFFDICVTRGLTGHQGVLVPASNVKHLMLRKDVVEAVRSKQFAIWPVTTIEQGIELLTGVPAGERGPGGSYPAESVYGRVEDTLGRYAAIRKAYPAAGNGSEAAERHS